jgi:ABC-type uncharacterized transport system permease subunit
VIQPLTVLLPVAYGTAAGLALLDFVAIGARGDDTPGRGARRMIVVRRAALAIAIVSHAALFWSLSALALVVAMLHVVVAARQGVRGTDGPVLGAVFVLQLVASMAASLEPVAAPPRPLPFYLLHVTSILVASAALVLSGVYGGLYLLLFRQMRRRKFGAVFERLPGLETLSRLMRRTGLAAFVMLLVGINGGIWWAHAASIPGFTYGDPGVLLMLGLCVYFAGVAFSSRIPGLTARRTSAAAAVGLLLLLASLAVFVTHSSFHWTE